MKLKTIGILPNTTFGYKGIKIKFKNGFAEINDEKQIEVAKKFDGKYWEIEKELKVEDELDELLQTEPPKKPKKKKPRIERVK